MFIDSSQLNSVNNISHKYWPSYLFNWPTISSDLVNLVFQWAWRYDLTQSKLLSAPRFHFWKWITKGHSHKRFNELNIFSFCWFVYPIHSQMFHSAIMIFTLLTWLANYCHFIYLKFYYHTYIRFSWLIHSFTIRYRWISQSNLSVKINNWSNKTFLYGGNLYHPLFIVTNKVSYINQWESWNVLVAVCIVVYLAHSDVLLHPRVCLPLHYAKIILRDTGRGRKRKTGRN